MGRKITDQGAVKRAKRYIAAYDPPQRKQLDHPNIADAPGLAWRQRADGWIAIWIARADIVKKGYSPSTQRLRLFTDQPTVDDVTYIQSECQRLQDEMLAFGRDGAVVVQTFTGTVQGLIDAYLRDPDSGYHSARFTTRQNYDKALKLLSRDKGERALHALKGRDFKRWYEEWRWPDGKGGIDKVYTAYGQIAVIRVLLSYGVAFEIEDVGPNQVSHCLRLKTALAEQTFENGNARTEELTHAQCSAFIRTANAGGEDWMALAQAFQFELSLRQKDVIGQWVPVSEPGISDLTRGGKKWLYGLRWEEIDQNLILTHQMTKSRKRKILEFDLKLYPMVMAEIAKIPAERRVGPIILNPRTGQPPVAVAFRFTWRKLATKAGIPPEVKNMDSRAGAITETLEATGDNIEAARKQAGHSNAQTTQRYSRGLQRSNSKVAVLRVASRTKTKPEQA